MTMDPKEFEDIKAYMDEYYAHLTGENKLIGNFLLDSSRQFFDAPGLRVLDVGCGPSALYWALFMPGIQRFECIDAQGVNFQYLAHLQAEIFNGRIEPRYREVADYVWRRLGSPQDEGNDAYIQSVAGKMVNHVEHDLSIKWSFARDGRYHVVISDFGLDCLPDPDTFQSALKEAYRVLAPGGRLILVALCETNTWKVGSTVLRCLYLTQRMLADVVERSGFKLISLEPYPAKDAKAAGQPYDKMLFCHAIRPF